MSLLPLKPKKLKLLNTSLVLIGTGYLKYTHVIDNHYIAHLKLQPCYSADGNIKDEVTLDCLVTQWKLQSLLNALDYERAIGRTVLVKFIANYHEVSSTFSTMTKCDPEQLINIEASLTQVLQVYVDDELYIQLHARTANG